ncbi:MAG: hypothetical protein CL561_03705 [Alphaproteobacteria bacterium]|nr:hypothetical protein [Alphaproteobacteria bacterium]|tara:strand:- start:7330 stop:7956 length:627 start_codon:yes stop_codon:yes gene_type:complete
MTTIDDALDKQNKITDDEISKVFRRLIANNKISEKAVVNKQGNLRQYVGVPNSLSEYFKRCANIGVKHVPSLTEEQVLQNEDFKTYRAQLNAQGYDVEIKSTRASEGAKGASIASTVFKGSAIGFVTLGGPFAMVVGGAGCGLLSIVSERATFDTAARIDLKIKKLDRVALPTPVAQDEEQAEANALLQEINQQATKQAVKEFVAIIK